MSLTLQILPLVVRAGIRAHVRTILPTNVNPITGMALRVVTVPCLPYVARETSSLTSIIKIRDGIRAHVPMVLPTIVNPIMETVPPVVTVPCLPYVAMEMLSISSHDVYLQNVIIGVVPNGANAVAIAKKRVVRALTVGTLVRVQMVRRTNANQNTVMALRVTACLMMKNYRHLVHLPAYLSCQDPR